MHEGTNPKESGVQFPDSIAGNQRAVADWLTAKDAHDQAFARWVAFVKEGAIPNDLKP